MSKDIVPRERKVKKVGPGEKLLEKLDQANTEVEKKKKPRDCLARESETRWTPELGRHASPVGNCYSEY